MGSVVISGATSGAVTLAVPDEAGTRTLTLPATTGTILTNDISQAGDTSAGNAAAVGYTSAEGLILTGQGSTSDVTIKNDADATVLSIPTGTTKVGIGHAAAASTLDVLLAGNGNISGPTSGVWAARVVNEQDSDTYNGLSVQNRWANTSSFILEGAMGWDGSSAGYYPVFTIDGLGQAIFKPQRSEAMRIASDGKVGIGTTAPTRTLTVIGSVGNQFVGSQSQSNDTAKYGTYAGSHYHNAEQDVAGLVVLSDGTNNTVYLGGGVSEQNAATVLAFHTAANDATTGGSERMRINSDGRIGIASTGLGAVQVAVVINGQDWFFVCDADDGTDKFRVASSGNVQNANNSYGAISDSKLKENIVDASNKLANLKQVKIRNFNFKGDSQKQIGVVAQELETIFPSMVENHKDLDKDGNDLGTTTKSVKYSVFVPMLIKAMQEQQTVIEALEARITALEGS